MSADAHSPSKARWLPRRTGPARWIVCERTGRWATALRREVDGTRARIYETRSLCDGWDELGRAAGSFVVAELTQTNLGELLDRLATLGRQDPWARAGVVAERALVPYEDLVREAGAVCFVTSPREAALLAAVAERHLDQVPSPSRGLQEQIWAALPWSRDK